MEVYFGEATKTGDGLSASRKQFIQFKNYLDYVGDTQCTIKYPAYNSLSRVEAFKTNTACQAHANQTACAKDLKSCTWRGSLKTCETF